MPRRALWIHLAAALTLASCGAALWASSSEEAPFLHNEGELYGSLKSNKPIPLYDNDPNHLWNRLYATLYIRESNLPSQPGGTPVKRYEGGDGIDFFGWSGTTYWSEPATIARIETPLDEFLKRKGETLLKDPLKRVLFQRDLWAAHDFYVNQNIIWAGTRDDRQRRDRLTKKLARAIAALALPASELDRLPDNYAAALTSGAFASKHDWDAGREYLPAGLFNKPEEWIEVDFWRPLDIHEDIEDRFVALHTRAFKGRSVFRVLYRWPGGRPALNEYLKYLDTEGIDWKFAASRGFVRLNKGLKQIPADTEVALVQSLTALDDQLNPVATKIVETVRLRTFKNAEGIKDDQTHSGNGMNVYEYILRRRLAFDGLKNGGLEREPNEMPQYRVILKLNATARTGAPAAASTPSTSNASTATPAPAPESTASRRLSTPVGWMRGRRSASSTPSPSVNPAPTSSAIPGTNCGTRPIGGWWKPWGVEAAVRVPNPGGNFVRVTGWFSTLAGTRNRGASRNQDDLGQSGRLRPSWVALARVR